MKQYHPKLTKINEIDQDSKNLVCRNEVKSDPMLTKINYIAQFSKNLVGQNGTKLTKVTRTQSNEMNQNEPKWSEVEQSGPKRWDPVNQN